MNTADAPAGAETPQQPVPDWLAALADRLRGDGSGPVAPALRQGSGSRLLPRALRSRAVPPGMRTRPASVLMLFGERDGADCAGPVGAGPDGEAPDGESSDGESPDGGALDGGALDEAVPDADVLLTQRASTLRHHSGQVAFPGGAADPGDDGPVFTALREAEEETGLKPDGVQPLAVMPELYVPPSGFLVSPVLAYWREQCPVGVVDEGETSRVARVPLRELVDPANRFQVRYRKMFSGPAFVVDGMLVWGFTASLLTALIAEGGWEREWDTGDVRELDVTLAEVDEQAAQR